MPSPGVAFAVPVTGAVAIATSVRAATPPPPPNRPAAPKPRVFVPGQGEGGTFPWPTSYPREALEQHASGTVMLYVVVDAAGSPEKVEVKDTSRFHVLDQYALQWVKRNWRWLPGETRYFYVPFEFKLR
jgi:protein TonB